ncbi:hypothetical protein ACSOSP_07885 [Caballeronia sp. KNU42]
MKKTRLTLIMFSAIIYALSISQQAYCFSTHSGPAICEEALGVLGFGMLGFFQAEFDWLANPLLWLAWFFLFAGNDIFALRLVFLATVVGNIFWIQGISESEGGAIFRPVISVGFGYWLWLASMLLTAVSAIYCKVRRRYLSMRQ